jgi:hypothetical protein
LGKELDGGFRDVRALKDIRYTLNAMDGPPIKGRAVGTYPREDLAHAIWKIVPIQQETVSHVRTNMLDFSGIVISDFDSPLISPFLDLVALV